MNTLILEEVKIPLKISFKPKEKKLTFLENKLHESQKNLQEASENNNILECILDNKRIEIAEKH